MIPKFKEIPLQLVKPSFDSKLLDAIMELNHLRRLQLGGSTNPILFFQLKRIFHMLESIGSARIEGNRTTISEYIETKIDRNENSTDKYTEIANVEIAMQYIEESVTSDRVITNHFIRELHHLTVNELVDEGDKTPGVFRSGQVVIAQSDHLPPEPHLIQQYMDELIEFINTDHGKKYDLIKVAIVHHRFAWIHPFNNGNGRVVRLLTYALLIKYGFKVKDGQILNPTAVFCNDRDKYYEMLSIADKGNDKDILKWCEYVLTGICQEISKINKLLDFDYLLNYLLKPAIAMAKSRNLISAEEHSILNIGIEKQVFKSSDLSKLKLNDRQRVSVISRLKQNGLIKPTKEGARTYYVVFFNNYLMRSLMKKLEEEGFIPPIDT